jgi:tetratricopeptide (TPR) repeat protein
MCNLLAMTYLQQEDFAMVLELLKKAEILTERDDPGKAVTLNNLACYYRRQGKLHAALQYLHRALKIEARLGSKVCTRILFCVIYVCGSAKLIVSVDNDLVDLWYAIVYLLFYRKLYVPVICMCAI